MSDNIDAELGSSTHVPSRTIAMPVLRWTLNETVTVEQSALDSMVIVTSFHYNWSSGAVSGWGMCRIYFDVVNQLFWRHSRRGVSEDPRDNTWDLGRLV